MKGIDRARRPRHAQGSMVRTGTKLNRCSRVELWSSNSPPHARHAAYLCLVDPSNSHPNPAIHLRHTPHYRYLSNAILLAHPLLLHHRECSVQVNVNVEVKLKLESELFGRRSRARSALPGRNFTLSRPRQDNRFKSSTKLQIHRTACDICRRI